MEKCPGRTKRAIRVRTKKMGLWKETTVKTTWFPADLIFLKENFKKMATKELAEALNKTVSAVYHKCNLLGLKRRG